MNRKHFAASIICAVFFFRPVGVEARSPGYSQMAEGNNQACIIAYGKVRCWGFVGLSRGGTVGLDKAVIIDGVVHARQVAVGMDISCALTDDREVYCWSPNEEEASISGFDLSLDPRPVRIPELDGTVQLSFIDSYYCALGGDGAVACWGKMFGKNGGLVPRPVPGLAGAVKIGTAMGAVCGLMKDGHVRCWGPAATYNEGPWLGLDLAMIPPMTVDGLSDAVDIAGSHAVFHAVRRDGTIARWSAADLYETACATKDSTTGEYHIGEKPIVTAIPLVYSARKIFGALDAVSCAIRNGGKATCWAWSWGLGTVDEEIRVVERMPNMGVDIGAVAQMQLDERYSYAILADGAAYFKDCSGASEDWQPL